jgi:hypothetical protein
VKMVEPPAGRSAHRPTPPRRDNGRSVFTHRLLFIANALEQHDVALNDIGDGMWAICFNPVPSATLEQASPSHPRLSPSVTHEPGHLR